MAWVQRKTALFFPHREVVKEADPLAKNNADTSDTLEKSGSLNPAIWIVSLIALAAVAATAIIIILKRKKQQD